MKKLLFTLLLIVSQVSAQENEAIYQVEKLKVNQAPKLSNFDFWSRLEKAKLTEGQTFQAFHNGDRLFLLLSFSSEQRSNKHKTWQSDKRKVTLSTDKETELHLLFNKTQAEAKSYDYWFWGSIRSNTYGYADDRQILVNQDKLSAKADTGSSAYSYQFNSTLIALREESHQKQKADGSRADVHCVGEWRDGEWQVLFSRKLNTKMSDDIHFQLEETYRLSTLNSDASVPPLISFRLLKD